MKKAIIILASTIFSLTAKAQVKSQGYRIYEEGNTGIYLSVSGVAFTLASILEGGYQYGTWVNDPQPGNLSNQKYVIPSFIQQTPRQIMFFTGVTITITGILIAKKK